MEVGLFKIARLMPKCKAGESLRFPLKWKIFRTVIN